jgi:hypothetical protein
MENAKPAVAKFEAMGHSDVNYGHIILLYYYFI